MEQLSNCIPQLNAKLKTIGIEKAAAENMYLFEPAPFTPLNSEEDLIAVNDKVKDADFIRQSVQCYPKLPSVTARMGSR